MDGKTKEDILIVYIKNIFLVYIIGVYIGLTMGSILSIAGLFMTIQGFTGSITWIFETGGVKSKIVNATPGIVFMVAGVILLCVFKPRGIGRKMISRKVVNISSRIDKVSPNSWERFLKLVSKTGKHYRQFPKNKMNEIFFDELEKLSKKPWKHYRQFSKKSDDEG